MRILILVPTNIHKSTAGTRIRYDRLRMASQDCEIAVQSLEEIVADELDGCDVCIFSKTYSVEAIVLARQLRRSGKFVGVDMFDDYFTQADDSRLTRFRMWLHCMVDVCQFALCSTQVMRDILRSYAPQLPIHVVPDPFAEIDTAFLARTAEEKLQRAKNTRVIDVVWYGNGSNPFFSVGLQDVAAYAWSLADLAAGSFDVQLRILTDAPSLTASNLSRLRKLPIPYQIDVWSLEREQQELERAFVSFIPVNGQSFSRAKSFNRALTAISAGTQVLSPGFPLYRELAPAIYADATELLYDLEQGRCRISSYSVGEVTRVAAAVSEVESVANSFFQFLHGMVQAESRQGDASKGKGSLRDRSRRQALVYGLEYDGVMVRAARATGILQVKTPFVRRDRAYDIQFEQRDRQQLDLWISPKLTPYLSENLKSKCSKPQQRGKYSMIKVDAGAAAILAPDIAVRGNDTRGIVKETDAYRRFLYDIERICREIFPTIQFSVCDMEGHFEESQSERVERVEQ